MLNQPFRMHVQSLIAHAMTQDPTRPWKALRPCRDPICSSAKMVACVLLLPAMPPFQRAMRPADRPRLGLYAEREVTACNAAAQYSTFDELIPAMEIRPSFVR